MAYQKYLLLVCLMPLLAGIRLSAQGIEFFHGTWPEALEKAKAENKLIFVDAFASWCGPCKKMAASVFPDSKAGEFFNPNFVNLKIDMEKPENAEFARKFPVGSYPTLMFLDSEGKLVLKDVGARPVEGLLELGRKALSKQGNTINFEAAYNEGRRDSQFMFDYVKWLNRTGKPSLKITNEYFKTQNNLDTRFNLLFLIEGTTEADSRVFDQLIQRRSGAEAVAGKDAVAKQLERACRNTVKKAIEFRNADLLDEAKNKCEKALPEMAGQFALESDMSYYAGVGDARKYLKAAQSFQKNHVKNATKQHDLVISMLRAFPDEPKVLEQAEKWSRQAAENGGRPEYFLTLAEIYKRQGKNDLARRAAEDARKAIGEEDNGMRGKIEYFLQSL